MSLVKPDQEKAVFRKQEKQKEQHDHGTKILRSFMPGETVAVRQFRGPDKWKRGVVVQRLGPTSYIVQVANRTLHVHVDHLIPAPEEEDNTLVTVAHPTLVPDRPTCPSAEARNPAHSLGPTPLEQLSPVPTASTPVPVPSVPVPTASTPVPVPPVPVPTVSTPVPVPPVPVPESASSEGSSLASVMPDLPVTSVRKPAAESSQPTPSPPRTSTRVRKKPVRLDL